MKQFISIALIWLTFIFTAHAMDAVKSVNSQSIKTFRDCPDCPEMVVIPPGTYYMGSDEGNDESPSHLVTISKPLAIGKTEVTQGQWKSIMGSNPSRYIDCGDDCPVENISWDDAHEFIQKINAKTGKQYRLPSEAEWEYACNAGEQYEFCGSDNVNVVAWYYATSSQSTHPVATKQPNAWGLFDMSGNVWEWVEDSYHPNYNGAPMDGAAWQGSGVKRVLRGGSWFLYAYGVRSTYRNFNNPTFRYYDIGFRLASTPP